jgi:hypothetical protein
VRTRLYFDLSLVEACWCPPSRPQVRPESSDEAEHSGEEEAETDSLAVLNSQYRVKCAPCLPSRPVAAFCHCAPRASANQFV